MDGLTPEGPTGKIHSEPHLDLLLTQPPMNKASQGCALPVPAEVEERSELDQNGKHFQTLFTTVTVTKSSLKKKKC